MYTALLPVLALLATGASAAPVNNGNDVVAKRQLGCITFGILGSCNTGSTTSSSSSAAKASATSSSASSSSSAAKTSSTSSASSSASSSSSSVKASASSSSAVNAASAVVAAPSAVVSTGVHIINCILEDPLGLLGLCQNGVPITSTSASASATQSSAKASASSSAGNVVASVIAPVASAASSVVAPVVSAASSVVAPVASAASSVVAPVASAASSVVAPVASAASSVVAPVASAASSVVAPVVSQAASVVAPVASAASSVVAPAVSQAASVVAPVASAASSVVAPAVSQAVSVVAPAASSASAAVSSVVSIVNPVASSVSSIISSVAATSAIPTSVVPSITSTSTTPSATPSPSNAAVSGWVYANCVAEGTSGRALTGSSFAGSGMTVESCLASCAAGGFPLAGLEYSSECYCGSTLANGASLTNTGTCAMTCSGNPGEICGGSATLSLYKSTGSNAAGLNSDLTSATVALPAGWASTTCMQEVSGRAFTKKSTASDSMTIGQCLSFCGDSKYAGLEYGRECYCADTLSNGASLTSTSGQCVTPCSGAASTTCGGPNALQVYTNSNFKASSSGAYSNTGCVQEVDGRLLRGASIAADNMTIETCTGFCQSQGMTIAGLEYGRECYCGNSYVSTPLQSGQCNMPCAGSASENCGGPNALNIFTLGA